MAKYRCLIAGQAGKSLVLHGKPVAVGDDGTCEVQDEGQLAWLRAQPGHWVEIGPAPGQDEPAQERAPTTHGGPKTGRKGKQRR